MNVIKRGGIKLNSWEIIRLMMESIKGRIGISSVFVCSKLEIYPGNDNLKEIETELLDLVKLGKLEAAGEYANGILFKLLPPPREIKNDY